MSTSITQLLSKTDSPELPSHHNGKLKSSETELLKNAQPGPRHPEAGFLSSHTLSIFSVVLRMPLRASFTGSQRADVSVDRERLDASTAQPSTKAPEKGLIFQGTSEMGVAAHCLCPTEDSEQ